MLRELRIRNFAVIESLAVSFEPGLNVLTGETGAGKSILIDAILLIRGARAQTDLIRAEVETATVEAVFDVGRVGPVVELLDESGLQPDEGTIVVRRELSRSGRHRAFVNDTAVTVGLLERLGDRLVDVHGQHEHQRLLEPATQLALLDRYARAEELREAVAALFGKYRAARDEVERMRLAERDRAQRQDLLRFQVGELEAAHLQSGEDEALRAERRRLQHAEKFAVGLAQVAGMLHDEPGAAVTHLARAARLLRDLGRLDPEFAAPADSLEGAQALVEDALGAVRTLREGVVSRPGRLEDIDDRLDALTRLKRKYGDTEAAMLAFRDDAAAELERLEHHEEFLASEERKLAELHGELIAAAARLTQARGAAAGRLAALAEREIRALGMERARFEIFLESLEAEALSARGLDRVELRFAPNPGEEARPLARIASGGELSRTMLALEAVLAATERIPTMIFDEVDAGIGGGIADVVADKLAQAASGGQVLCVTHLAQVAARADHHVRVSKAVRGGRTRAGVMTLTGDERVQEIARMLGGASLTEVALRHARALLGARRSRRP